MKDDKAAKSGVTGPAMDEYTLLRLFWKRIRFWLGVLLCIFAGGIVGYRVLEHLSWLEAVYRAVVVLTTLGLPTHPANPSSTAFTIVLALAGIGSVVYAAGSIAQLIVADEFKRALGLKKEMRRMKQLNNHFIICGYGRIGEIVVGHLRDHGLATIVVDRNAAVVQHLEEQGQLAFHGDASRDEVLEQVRLRSARAAIVVTSSDAENVLITMTARLLSPTVPIIVRCDEDANTSKFLRAGATRVITPNTTGANQIALAAVKPHVIDLLIGLASGTGEQAIGIFEVHVPAGSDAVGQSLRELALGSRFGVVVIGIKPLNRQMQFNPSADSVLSAGDVLVTVGKEERFRELEAFLGEIPKA